jgi:hypothetical protein
LVSPTFFSMIMSKFTFVSSLKMINMQHYIVFQQCFNDD